jgi:hypothetical protein
MAAQATSSAAVDSDNLETLLFDEEGNCRGEALAPQAPEEPPAVAPAPQEMQHVVSISGKEPSPVGALAPLGDAKGAAGEEGASVGEASDAQLTQVQLPASLAALAEYGVGQDDVQDVPMAAERPARASVGSGLLPATVLRRSTHKAAKAAAKAAGEALKGLPVGFEFGKRPSAKAHLSPPAKRATGASGVQLRGSESPDELRVGAEPEVRPVLQTGKPPRVRTAEEQAYFKELCNKLQNAPGPAVAPSLIDQLKDVAPDLFAAGTQQNPGSPSPMQAGAAPAAAAPARSRGQRGGVREQRHRGGNPGQASSTASAGQPAGHQGAARDGRPPAAAARHGSPPRPARGAAEQPRGAAAHRGGESVLRVHNQPRPAQFRGDQGHVRIFDARGQRYEQDEADRQYRYRGDAAGARDAQGRYRPVDREYMGVRPFTHTELYMSTQMVHPAVTWHVCYWQYPSVTMCGIYLCVGGPGSGSTPD